MTWLGLFRGWNVFRSEASEISEDKMRAVPYKILTKPRANL